MSNERFYCKTLKRMMSKASCIIRLENGFCNANNCFIRKREKMAKKENPKCKEEGCDKFAWKGGFCYRHFYIHNPKKPTPSEYHSKKYKEALESTKGLDVTDIVQKINSKIDYHKGEIDKLEKARETIEVL